MYDARRENYRPSHALLSHAMSRARAAARAAPPSLMSAMKTLIFRFAADAATAALVSLDASRSDAARARTTSGRRRLSTLYLRADDARSAHVEIERESGARRHDEPPIFAAKPHTLRCRGDDRLRAAIEAMRRAMRVASALRYPPSGLSPSQQLRRRRKRRLELFAARCRRRYFRF